MSDIFNTMRNAVKRVDRLNTMIGMFNEAETIYVIRKGDKLIAMVYGIHELQAFLSSVPTSEHYTFTITEFDELISLASDMADVWKQVPKWGGFNYLIKVGEKVYAYVYRPKIVEHFDGYGYVNRLLKGGYREELKGMSIASRDKLKEMTVYTRPNFKEIDWLSIDKNIVTIFKKNGKLYGCNKDIHYIYSDNSDNWKIVSNPEHFINQDNEDKLDKALYPIVIEIPKYKYHGQILNYLDDWNKIPHPNELNNSTYSNRDTVYINQIKRHKQLLLKRPKGL